MRIYCPDCNTTTTLQPDRWRCECGGAWEPLQSTAFDQAMIRVRDTSIWRYQSMYGLDSSMPIVRLGAGWTPLLPIDAGDHSVRLKLEFMAPTGSFKDRGTGLMINVLLRQGVMQIADDSSGNAGASAAAYAARADMKADIFVPEHASPAKLAQIYSYGATVHTIPGPRENAKLAAIEQVGSGSVYASHAYHPAFLLGQESIAWELWEQLEGSVPDWYVVPVGQGVHLLGACLGFWHLRSAGLIERLPRMVGVQPSLLAPLHTAVEQSLDAIPAVEAARPSIAEGLAIAQPVRGKRLLQAIHETGGTTVAVREEAILAAQRDLGTEGLHVEPTSAAAFAALPAVLELADPGELIVVPLTGSGLKGAPTLIDHPGLD